MNRRLALAFGEVLRDRRGNMPQIALAGSSGVKIDRVAALEAGHDEPCLDEIFKLATALDMQASELVALAVNATTRRR